MMTVDGEGVLKGEGEPEEERERKRYGVEFVAPARVHCAL